MLLALAAAGLPLLPARQEPTSAPAQDPEQQVASEAWSEPIADCSPAALRLLYLQAQAALRDKLLAPRGSAADLARFAGPDSGVDRLLDAQWARSLKRGSDVLGLGLQGGSGISFQNHVRTWSSAIDLVLERGRFTGSLLGRSPASTLMALGPRPIHLIRKETPPWLAELDSFGQGQWKRLWMQPVELDSIMHGTPGPAQFGGSRLGQVGDVYALRSHQPRVGLSCLTVFEVLERSHQGATIGWRVLRRWPLEASSPARMVKAAEQPLPPGPAWLQALDEEQLVAFLPALQEQATRLLTTVPIPLMTEGLAALGWTAESEDCGVAVLHRQDLWTPLFTDEDTGWFQPFGPGQHVTKNKNPDLVLDSRGFLSDFRNDLGRILHVGPVGKGQLRKVLAGDPGELPEAQREAWTFLRELPTLREPKRASLDRDDTQRALAHGLTTSSPALIGHTYLVRTTEFPDLDRTTVLTVLGEHERGLVLAYRVLEDRPIVH